MKSKLSYCLLLLLWACTNGQQNSESKVPEITLTPALVALVVQNVDSSSNWYSEKLGFKSESAIEDFPDYKMRIGFLELNGFRLELIENALAIPKDSLPIPADGTLNGYLKLGFMVDDIKYLYNQLTIFEDVDFVTEIGDLPATQIDIKWPGNYFLIRDPDGNLIQFFSYESITTMNINMRPWLMGTTVQKLEETSQWYQDVLGFKDHINVGNPGNQRNIIERDDFILELFEPHNVQLYRDIEGAPEFHGIRKLSLSTYAFDHFADQLKNSNVKFVLEPDSIDSSWASRSMIFLDNEGNWIQVFDLNLD